MDPSRDPSVDHEAATAQAPRPEWFEQLYRDSHARVYNLAARVVGDRDDAADITQEVFLRAYTHPPDEHGMRKPERWLYRVTVNACYDHLRRRANRATSPLEHAGEVASARDGFAAAEMTHAVEDALGTLNVRYRTALVLRDLHGLGTGEVADVMGVSRATARVLLHRSRAAFRRAFRETAPAGAGPLPALGLAVLPALAVPAALQAPPLVAALTPAAPIALASLPHAALPAAGLLTKIGAALGLKGAVVVAAAVVVTGSAVATHDLSTTAPARHGSTVTATAPAQSVVGGAEAGGAGESGNGTQKRAGRGVARGDAARAADAARAGMGAPVSAAGDSRGNRSAVESGEKIRTKRAPSATGTSTGSGEGSGGASDGTAGATTRSGTGSASGGTSGSSAEGSAGGGPSEAAGGGAP